MWPNFFTGFPFSFPSIGRANFNTLPTVAVTVGTENVTLELPNHAFRNRSYVGGFYVSLRQVIPAGTTATLPILIGTNGDTRPLLAYNNEPVTVGNLPERVSTKSTITSTPTNCSLLTVGIVRQPHRHRLRQQKQPLKRASS